MAAPPRPTRRWKSTSASVTCPFGAAPSKVAALMKRFRSVTGPSRAGSNGVPARRVAGSPGVSIVTPRASRVGGNLESIPHAAHRGDDRGRRGVRLHVGPQALDVDVEGLGVP